MNNVHDIREAKSTERQASEWLALLTSGDASADDRARFDAWLHEHPVHRAAFDEVSRTWGRLRAMGEYFAAEDTGAHEGIRLGWAAAAAAILVVAIGGMLLYPFDSSMEYHTEVGQQMNFTLPDRSMVALNTGTELRVAYSDSFRTIELLRGEAYFDVAHDTSRPFVVEAGRGEIRAVGTGFVVRLQDDAVKVTVTEGIVEVTHDAIERSDGSVAEIDEPPSTQLAVGQRVEYDRRAISMAALEPKELDRDLAWRQGLIIFDGQTLEEVIREVGRYTEVNLIIADSDLHDLRVGGAFQAGDLEAVLEFFEKGLNVSVNRDVPHTVYLTASRPVIAE